MPRIKKTKHIVQSEVPSPSLALENIMLQLNPELILRHYSHMALDVIIHPLPPAEPLPNLAGPERDIGGEQDQLEQNMAPRICPPLGVAQVPAVYERATGPESCQLDTVDGRAEELIVSLHNPHVAANEEELAWKVLLLG